jgi:uncharacterized protein
VAALLLSLGAVFVYFFVRPLPPRSFTISTGRPGGAYHAVALEYQKVLARKGYRLQVLPGAGSIETLERLRSGQALVGFVQAGTASMVDASGLSALGSLFYEPIWVFYRKLHPLADLRELRGKRVAIGEAGSGTRPVALQLLRLNEVTEATTELLPLSHQAAADQLAGGNIDAAFFVLSPAAPIIQELLTHREIELLTIRRHLAYSSRLPHLTSITLGEGIVDLRANLPSSEKTLLAVTANLAARDDIHPELIRLLLGVAEEVHRRGGLLERPNQFPSDTLVELPLHEDARHYLRRGPSWLERVFPFSVAVMIERVVLLLLPAFGLVFSLVSLVPAILRSRVRSRIGRCHQMLHDIDRKISGLRLREIEPEVHRVKVLQADLTQRPLPPRPLIGEFYDLQVYCALVLGRLDERRRELRDVEPSRLSGGC